MISVVIPTYNRAHVIKRSIESVLNQSYTDFELLIVDDGSVDNTEEVVKRIKDKRIRYIKKENGGAGSARNFGVKCAKGEYVVFQDSDDVWRKNKLEVQYNDMVSSGADVVFCRFDRHNYSLQSEKLSVLPRIPGGFVSFEQLVKESVVSTQTVFSKRSVLINIPFDDSLRKLEDYEWAIRAGEKYKFFLTDEVLVDVYLQNDSITHNGSDLAYIEMIYDRNKEMLKRHPTALAYMLNYVGDSYEQKGMRGTSQYYRAFKQTKDLKYLLKAGMAQAGLLKLYKGESQK